MRYAARLPETNDVFKTSVRRNEGKRKCKRSDAGQEVNTEAHVDARRWG